LLANGGAGLSELALPPPAKKIPHTEHGCVLAASEENKQEIRNTP
jgi:hypothetical protein